MRDNGIGFESACRLLEAIKGTGRVFFTIGSMEYLIANVRIGTLTGTFVQKLGIRPIIDNKGGGLNMVGMARGRKKSIVAMLDAVKKHLRTINVNDYLFVPGYCTNRPEFDEYVQTLVAYLKVQLVDPPVRIGTTIATHGGPDIIGIAMIKKYDA